MKSHLFVLSSVCLLVAVGVCATLARQAPKPPDEQPAVVSAVAPVFPAIAIAARVSGSVTVEVKIDAQGNVSAASAVEGHQLLKKMSESAATRWRFVPTTPDSGVRSARLTFAFRMADTSIPASEATPVFFPPYKVEVTNNSEVVAR